MMSKIAITGVTLLLAAVLVIPIGLASLFFSPMLIGVPFALAGAGDSGQRSPSWMSMWRSSSSSDTAS